jgi:beta-lactamase superfamily II metal-dependent hydrolase
MYHMSRPLHSGFYVFLLGILILANVIIYRTIFATPLLTVSVLDVGEGGGENSATLVRTPGGATLLIDTGPDASILRALGTALPPWQRSLDAVILTSDKKASVGGLPDVLNRYRVGQQISLTGDRRLNLGDHTFINLTQTKNAPAGVSVSTGESVTKIR